MDKETLFRDVRRGEVLLWVGAGFSRYAGFPMGQKTVELLHESLSISEQDQLDSAQALPRYSEELVDLHNGSRYHLIRELQRMFRAAPTSKEYHEVLAKIPFLDKIVTTNYDTLFEQVYGGRLHKIMSGHDIPLGEPNQVEFYKIHGDVDNPGTEGKPGGLVVTEKDYRSFFKKQDELLWKQLETLMAKRTVLFLGYSLEDLNVLALFEELLDKLGAMHRGAYLVAPGFKATTINRLRQRRVTYLDMKGEDFVEELMLATKANVLPDLAKGLVSSDKTSLFLSNLGLDFSYNSNSLGLTTQSLKLKDGTAEQHTFSIQVTAAVAAQIDKLRTLDSTKPIRLAKSDIYDFRQEVEGIRMPSIDIRDLIISPSPNVEKKLDLILGNEVRLYDISVFLYRTIHEIRVVAVSQHSLVKIVLNLDDSRTGVSPNCSFKISPRGGVLASIAAGLEVVAIMREIGQGTNCQVFETGKLVWTALDLVSAGFKQKADNLLHLLQSMQLIEKTFGIVFRNFDYTDQDAEELIELAGILRMQAVKWRSKGSFKITTFDPPPVDLLDTMKRADLEEALRITDTCIYTFDTMGWKFQVEFSRSHAIEQPVFTATKTRCAYELKSNTQTIITTPTKIISTEVLTYGQPLTVKSIHDQVLESL